MGEIVQGPWGSRKPDPTSPDDNEVMQEVQLNLEILMNSLYCGLQDIESVDKINDEYYNKDMILIAECIRSLLQKYQNRYHACQDIADNLFFWDGNNFQTQNSLYVEFK